MTSLLFNNWTCFGLVTDIHCCSARLGGEESRLKLTAGELLCPSEDGDALYERDAESLPRKGLVGVVEGATAPGEERTRLGIMTVPSAGFSEARGEETLRPKRAIDDEKWVMRIAGARGDEVEVEIFSSLDAKALGVYLSASKLKKGMGQG